MNQPSFLARKTYGYPNYLLLALGLAFVVAFIPRGTRRAIESNNNNAKDWLPPTYAESTDLKWFHSHFIGEQFALVSYDGCTYGDHEKLDHLARNLTPGWKEILGEEEDTAVCVPPAPVDTESPTRWFKRVITGPSVVGELMRESRLSEGEALKRMEGFLVGPRERDKEGNLLPQESRSTCLVVTLTREATKDNKNMRKAIEAVEWIAQTECAIPAGKEKLKFFPRISAKFSRAFLGGESPPDILHMGGPPVDNVSIDIEGERTLYRLAGLSGIVGLLLSYWCFRSVKVTSFVFSVGVISAGMSLAIVFYYGVIEVFGFGLPKPRYGTVDAILMSMPAVVYVLGLSGAIHIVNYYKDARREDGLDGAAEEAMRHGWGPCTLAALTTAIGLGSLFTSDIVPIKKFGMFTAFGVLATLGVLFTLLPIFLHRFPLKEKEIEEDAKRSKKKRPFSIDAILQHVGGFVVKHNVVVCVVLLLVMAFFASGFPRIQTSVQLLKLFDADADIIHDYEWLENHLGNLVPMEVILTLDPDQMRTGREGDIAESNGLRYRMTMLERVQMVQRIEKAVESLPQIGRALCVPTFIKDDLWDAYGGGDYAINAQLEKAQERLLAGDYLRQELDENGKPTGRELWRISARVRALDDGRGNDMDYGEFVAELRNKVDPIILSYRQRDVIMQRLSQEDKRLGSSRFLILFRGPVDESQPNLDSQESLLSDLLLHSGPKTIPIDGKHKRRVGYLNLAKLGGTSFDKDRVAKVHDAIQKMGYDAAVIVSAGSQDRVAKSLTQDVLPLIDVSELSDRDREWESHQSASMWAVEMNNPQPVAAVHTGVVPLVYKTQRELLSSLRTSILLATVLIAGVMILVFRSPFAGLMAMIPNVFPVVVVFGALGWLGIKVDIGIMMTASVALGVAVDDTIHFVWWFRHGIKEGMDRRLATLYAYERCGTAMTQTTIIAGLGLAVFATSTFTPTQQFGYLMITILSAALVGDLLLLPAILSGPIGKVFRGQRPEKSRGSKALDKEMPETIETQPSHPAVSDQVAATSCRRDKSHRRSARAS